MAYTAVSGEEVQDTSIVTAAPVRSGVRLAAVAILLSIAGFAVMAPFARIPLAPIPAFVPACESALALANLITAALLFNQFNRVGRLSVLVLAGGYLFSAAVVVAHALSFPGVFSPTGLLGATTQTTAWLFVFWHAGFPLTVLAYALLADSRFDSVNPGAGRRRAVCGGMAGAFVLAAGTTLLSSIGTDLLPTIVVNDDYFRLTALGISQTMVAVTLLAIAALWRRRRLTVLDTWLLAVLIAWFFDVCLSTITSSARYGVGWYGRMLFCLLAGAYVLWALLFELNALYGQLAASLATAEERNVALVQSRSELARAQRMEAVGQLTAGVAHDFNNLLTAVMGALEMIGRRPDDPARVAALAETASKAAMRGARLVRQLMTFSRQQNLRPELQDVNAIMAEAEGFASAIGGNVTIVLTLDPAALFVTVDESEFQAAMLNLISNARDAMPNGGVIRLTSAAMQVTALANDLLPGPYVRIAVTDTGEGMSAETRSKAFEPFFTTKPIGSGTGLGLSQVYGFTRSARGGVVITSEPGAGTTIELFLPRVSVTPDASVPPLPIAGANGRIVLVVEDDALVMETTSATLQELGYRTLQAETADAALAMLESGTAVDIMFSDISMPGPMNGTGLAAAARQMRPGLPVLLTSGNAMSSDDGRPSDVPVLSKPYRREALGEALHRALHGTPHGAPHGALTESSHG